MPTQSTRSCQRIPAAGAPASDIRWPDPGVRADVRVASAAGLDTLRDALRVRTLADALPSDSPSSRSPPTP